MRPPSRREIRKLRDSCNRRGRGKQQKRCLRSKHNRQRPTTRAHPAGIPPSPHSTSAPRPRRPRTHDSRPKNNITSPRAVSTHSIYKKVRKTPALLLIRVSGGRITLHFSKFSSLVSAPTGYLNLWRQSAWPQLSPCSVFGSLGFSSRPTLPHPRRA